MSFVAALWSSKARKRFYESVDQPCSALVLNCCQPACCVPANSFVEYNLQPSTSDWVQQLADIDSNVLLRSLILPGTHDSGSYTINHWKPFAGVARTQNFTILEQLLGGVRYIDLRIAGSSDNKAGARVWHGCVQGGIVEDCVQQMQDFLVDHPGEFVVLELVPEYGRDFSDNQKRHALKVAHEKLGELVVDGNDVMDVLQKWTVGDIQQQKKQVLVMVHPRFFGDDLTEDEVVSEYGFVNSHRYMKSKWQNTRKIDDLLDWTLADVNKYGKAKRRWHCTQMVMTPGVGGATDVVQALVGANSLRPVSMANRLYRKFDTWVRDQADAPWNIVMLDYVDLCPIAVHFLLALNFPVELEIRFAAVDDGDKPTDVTEKVQSLVKRGRALYLNVKEDLDCKRGSLTIAYRLGDVYQVLYVELEPDTIVLISHFVSTDEATTIEGAGNGYVSQGKICEDKSDCTGTILEYNHTGTSCDIKIVE